MPLTLISGPPKSGRAGEIRARLTEALPAEPVLVVPNADDVIRFERELAERAAAVLGASVRTFEGFFGDVADAIGAETDAPLGKAQRRRAIALAARDSGEPRMRALSARPGFLHALAETDHRAPGGQGRARKPRARRRRGARRPTSPASPPPIAATSSCATAWAAPTATSSRSGRSPACAPPPTPGAAGPSSSTASTT